MAIKTIPLLPQLLQVIHLLTAGIVLASLLVIVLRLHGLAFSGLPCAQVWRRFSPWFWCGMMVMALTGLTFILGEPLREFSALSFWLKVVLLATGMAGMLRLGKKLGDATAAEVAPATRRLALVLLCMWLLVGILGRFIGYDIPVWGTLSPRSNL